MVGISLNPADKQVISVLREGRNVAANIADETGYERQYITSRLRRLQEHGVVENIGKGVYELVSDPESEGSNRRPGIMEASSGSPQDRSEDSEK